jgi:hypothetical protein
MALWYSPRSPKGMGNGWVLSTAEQIGTANPSIYARVRSTAPSPQLIEPGEVWEVPYLDRTSPSLVPRFV